MKYSLFIRILKVFTIILLLSFSACSSETENEPIKAVEPVDAPGFTLKSTNGEDITLSDFKGKVVLLDFWATWCGPCMQSIPELVRLQQKYNDKGLVVLGVSMDELSETDDNQLKKFMETFNIQYDVMRVDGVVYQAYFGDSPTPIPIMHIINREGKIVKTIKGFTPGKLPEMIEDFI